MDGNKWVVQMLESGNMPYHRSFMFAIIALLPQLKAKTQLTL